MQWDVISDIAPSKPTPAARDAADWVRQHLAWQPDDQQSRVLCTPSKRGILNCCRQWGKSTVTAAKAVHRAATAPDSLVLVVSPSGRQSAEFLRKAAGFLRRHKIRVRGDGDNEMSLLLPNGSRIVGLPGTESTIRGYSAANLILIDEASRVSEEIYLAVRPMLATSNGDLWLMSTPWSKRGFFYDTWVNRDPDWERIQTPATGCTRISSKFLEEERRTMGDRCFRREYLCEFDDSATNIFSRDLIDRAIRPGVSPLVVGPPARPGWNNGESL